jgi:hypothetical protein
MELDLLWLAPQKLVPDDSLIYACPGLMQIPEAPGIYFFARRFGQSYVPLYIGRTESLRKRVQQHLETNVRLMRAILKAKHGERVVFAGEWRAHRGQQMKRVLPIVESALIKAALAEGNELFNDRGTKTQTHTLVMAGKRHAWQALSRSRQVLVERR